MGSWYYTIGRATVNTDEKSVCITKKCGDMPTFNSAGFQKWLNCTKQYDGLCSNITTRPSGDGIPRESTTIDTRPLELENGNNLELTKPASGISKNTMIMIGVGAIALIAVLMAKRG